MQCPYCGKPARKKRLSDSGRQKFHCGTAEGCGRYFTDGASLSQPQKSVSIRAPVDPDLPISELVEIRKRQFAQVVRHEETRKLIPVSVPIKGPVGIIHYGDPHIDDDGTDIASLERHALLVRDTEGLYAGNVGDTTNNWVGRLAKLYGEQGTTARVAWKLAEWWMELQAGKWLYVVGGNHDAWSGAGDPLNWISRQVEALYQSSEARLGLQLPGLRRTITVNVRHDFAGHSQWNPAHGVGKSVQLGTWDEISICGHKHVSGYMVLKSPTDGRVCHAIQVASYKIYDRYARERGFRDQAISPAVVTIINPQARTEAGLISVYWDVDEAVDYLKYLRSRA